MYEEKGLGFSVSIFETWIVVLLSMLLDTITLPFRFLIALFVPDDVAASGVGT